MVLSYGSPRKRLQCLKLGGKIVLFKSYGNEKISHRLGEYLLNIYKEYINNLYLNNNKTTQIKNGQKL